MRKQTASISTLPVKCLVRKFINCIPRKLLRNEIVNPAFFDNLRQGTAVTEGVGQPKNIAVNSEFAFKKLFTVKKLTNQRFCTGKINIAFNPSSTLNLDFSLLNGFLNS